MADRPVNVASVPHRSPFRYPGGKTWLVPRIRRWLDRVGPVAHLIEPFAGGAIVGLSALFDGLAGRITLVEKDPRVAAVWRALVDGHAEELAERIARFEVSEAAVRAALDATPATITDRAFATILRNRMQRGGILAPGASLMRAGENGRGLRSRWYPETLRRRLLDIGARSRQITFIEGDGPEVIQKHAHEADAVFFVDPPYTVAGRRLYAHNELDHAGLFRRMTAVRGDFLMTYDNVEAVRRLAEEHGLDTLPIAMKSTHHAVMTELLIGRNLAWARE